jgi:peptidyl-tRNA hydrolase, PTH1 family
MKLIVGLGNPGARYHGSRHNLGAAAVMRAAQRLQASFAHTTRHALWGRVRTDSGQAVLALPQTYMNLSGRAVAALARYLKIIPQEILVVSDDLNLPLGRLRFRLGGSAGGHNGMKSVIESLGSDEFHRLRIGIGQPDRQEEQADFVLSRFHPAEREAAAAALERAAEGILCWLDHGLDAAARTHNV